MRPVNAAVAPTCGQTERKEVAKMGKGGFGDTPNPGKGLRAGAPRPCALCTPLKR